MQENLRRYFENDAAENFDASQRTEQMNTAICSFNSVAVVDTSYKDIQRLLMQGYFVVLFGQFEAAAQRGQERKLLLLQRDDPKGIQLQQTLTGGQYFSFHADLFKGYNLKGRFNNFGFLRYALAESILLSGDELSVVEALFGLIRKECTSTTDEAHPHILISYIELLLQHMHRFYKRSFAAQETILTALNKQFETLLEYAFSLDERRNTILPSVPFFADELGVTSAYLNDVSQTVSKQSAQDRIDNKIIDCAKHLLASSGLSTAEIAERIGFAQPQSLNRLFKRKTKATPMEYRISLI